jgi:hypothetical protein
MNFFVFNTDTNTIEISGDFWIFIATWLPLTFLTGLAYSLWYWYPSRRNSMIWRLGKKWQGFFNSQIAGAGRKTRGSGNFV